MTFLEALRKANVNDAIIAQIMGVEYPPDANPKQDNANWGVCNIWANPGSRKMEISRLWALAIWMLTPAGISRAACR